MANSILSHFINQPSNYSLTEKLTQREATSRILLTPGFTKDQDDVCSQYGYRGEIQGNRDLRIIANKLTKIFPDVLSLEALKENRDVNIKQYLIFKVKRFTHTNSLEGDAFPIKLEGFCEAFTISMLASSFNKFDEDKKFFKREDKQWIKEHFIRINTSDCTEKNDIKEIVKSIQDPNFMDPILFGSGHVWHSTITFIWGNILIYGDRGNSIYGIPPGVHVYYLPDLNLITESVIWNITKRQEIERNHFFGIKRIEQELMGNLIYYEAMPPQEVGNCTYESMKIALYVLMIIRQLIKEFDHTVARSRVILRDSDKWKKTFKKLQKLYEAWTNFDRLLVLKDMMEEIKEWLDKKSDFSKNKFGTIYDVILKIWYEKYKWTIESDSKLSELIKPILCRFGL